MTPSNRPFKNTLALTLGVIASSTAAHIGPDAAAALTKRAPEPPVQIVRVSGGGAFDWGDAAIGAVAGFGLSTLTIGLRLLNHDHAHRRRHPNRQTTS